MAELDQADPREKELRDERWKRHETPRHDAVADNPVQLHTGQTSAVFGTVGRLAMGMLIGLALLMIFVWLVPGTTTGLIVFSIFALFVCIVAGYFLTGSISATR